MPYHPAVKRLLRPLKAAWLRLHPPQPDWLEVIRRQARRELPRLLAQVPQLPPSERKRILFWTLSPWSYTAVDAILATSLRLRGHEVVCVACDGLQFCECDQQGSPPCDRQCFPRISRYLDAFMLTGYPVSGYLQPADAAAVAELLATSTPDALHDLTVDGIPIGQHALVNSGYYCGVPATLWQAHDAQIYAKAVQTGYLLTKAAGAALRRHQPDIVITAGGRSIVWAPIYELARMQNRGTTNWEDWSVDPHGFRFDHRMPAIIGAIEQVWETEKARPLTPDQRETLHALFTAWKNSETTPFRYYDQPVEDTRQVCQALGVDAEQPVVAIFPNIVREDNRARGRAAFGNQVEWLSAVYRMAAALPEMVFVIRMHPAEVKLPASYIMNRMDAVLERFAPPKPDNVVLVPPESQISSYTLAGMAKGLMVWTGTLGLELALMGRRVIVAGDPGYRGKGFTEDLADETEMSDRLSTAMEHPRITDDHIALAERYSYLLRIRTLVRFPFHTGHKTREFSIPSFTDLASGNNPVIDDLCRCILEDAPFLDIGLREGGHA